MKPKLLLPISGLLGVIIAGIFACSKSNDVAANDVTANSKFKSNEWPTFTIPKKDLVGYFTNESANEVIAVMIRSDLNNSKSSMDLVAFGDRNSLVIKQDDNYKTKLNTKLGLGNNRILLSQISAICRANGEWIDNFEYLRLSPIESKAYPGYLAFVLSACDKDGKLLQLTSLITERTLSDSESQPSPPAACLECNPACPPGTHCNGNTGKCVAD